MKIVHWYLNFLKGGGTANAVLGLAKAQQNCGAQVCIVTAKANPSFASEELLHEVKFDLLEIEISGIGDYHIIVKKKYIKLVQSLMPDVVHVHGEIIPANIYVAKIFKCPIILSPHGGFNSNILQNNYMVKRIYLHYAKLKLYSKISAFHAISPIEIEDLRKIKFGKKVYVLPEGPSISTIKDQKILENDNKDVLRIIYVGRIDIYTKGIDILLEAFAAVVKSNLEKKIVLYLVGPNKNNNIEILMRMSAEHGLTEKVIFTGRLDGNKTNELLRKSDIYIQISRNDGFGLSVIEAMWIGLPAVLSENIGATRYEIFKKLNNVKVVKCEVGDVIIGLQNMIVELENIKNQGRLSSELVKKYFSWNRIAKKHIWQYNNIIKSK